MVNFQTLQSVQLFSNIPSRLPSVTAIEGYKGIKLRMVESASLGLLHANRPVFNRVSLLVTGGQGNPQRLFLYKFMSESGVKLHFSQFFCHLLLYKCKEGALMFQRQIVEIPLPDQGNLGKFFVLALFPSLPL